MKILYETGDFIERLGWIESSHLIVTEVKEDGLMVKALSPLRGSSYPAEPFFVEKEKVVPLQSCIIQASWIK
jgi:hypothetical protein